MADYDDDFLNFCQLLIDAQQRRLVDIFAGSEAEIYGNDYSLKEFAGADSSGGKDHMVYSRDSYVFSSLDDVPYHYRSEMIRYVSDKIPPGYVCILRRCADEELIGPDYNATTGMTLIEPSMEIDVGQRMEESSDYTEDETKDSNAEADLVRTYHSPFWPHEADEWITRQRPRDSLSHDVIRRVVGYGCDFVNASHKGYIERDKLHEWRCSFSVAELILIKNWSRHQRAVYRTIRVLHKRCSLNNGRESLLCSYFYKTMMLWAVEARPQCFWDDAVLIDSVRALLMDMIRCLEMKCLYHYFIPTNNLFDHLNSEDLSDDINALVNLNEDVNLISEVLQFCIDEEHFVSSSKEYVTMPQHLVDDIIVSTYLTESTFPIKLKMVNREKEKLVKSFRNELRTAYEVINLTLHYQKNLLKLPLNESINSYTDGWLYHMEDHHVREDWVTKIFHVNSKVFQRFAEIYPETDKDIDFEQWVQYCKASGIEERTSKMPSSTLQMKQLLYCRNERIVDLFSNNLGVLVHSTGRDVPEEADIQDMNCMRNLNLSSCICCPVNTLLTNTVKHHEFNPSVSPSIPKSWFTTKAYTANSYYTLLSDYETVIDMCDEIITESYTSVENQEVSENNLPFLLSTQWIEIYDRELQQVLGLAALHRLMIDESHNRPVHLPVCPVSFAHYLKMRCVAETEGKSSDQEERAFVDYHVHVDYCKATDSIDLSSTAALLSSYKLFRQMLES